MTYVAELYKYFSKFAKADAMVRGIKDAVAGDGDFSPFVGLVVLGAGLGTLNVSWYGICPHL